ncbi:MAG: FAD:protein FMN transferase [Pseudomonadota bacterium]
MTDRRNPALPTLFGLKVGALTLLLAFTPSCIEPPPRVVTIDFLAFSTTVSLSVYAPSNDFYLTTVPAIEARLATLDTRWRSFGDGSLGRLNDALERSDCATTDADTHALIVRALDYRVRSQGLFDPTLGIEVDHHGFRDTAQTERAELPTRKGAVSITDSTICADGPVRLDLGGIAKGAIALDLATLLRNHNAPDAIINLGGDLLVLGTRGPQPWRVAIQHPRAPGVIATFDVHDGTAVFSSGDYFRRRPAPTLEHADHDGSARGTADIDAVRARPRDDVGPHHILDPRTGNPARGAIATTVMHSDPVLADVAATALMVAGPQSFEEIAARLEIDEALLIDAELAVHRLPGTSVELPIRLR